MKRIKFNAFAFVAIISAVSCSQKEGLLSTDQPTGKKVPCESITLSASSEESVTKTHIDTVGNALNVFWDTLDVISVYDDLSAGVANEFSIKKETISGSSASFEGEASVGANTLWAVYPASAASGISGDNLSVTVPNEQVLKAGVGSDILPSVAKAAKGENLQFKNVCGILTVNVTYSNVTSIIVEGTNVAGTAKVDASTGTITQVTDGQSKITVTSDSTEFKKGVYYIAVLPGVTEAGNFSIAMVRKGGYSMKSTASKAFEVKRNCQSNFGALDTKLKWVFTINNKEELLAWNETASFDADTVYLNADIDLDGETWEPKDLRGTFYGQNHKIYNVSVTPTNKVVTDRLLGGFFARVIGTVQDLVLGSSNGSEYDGKSNVTIGATELTGWSLAGGVAASVNGGEIKNVTSFIPVEVSSGFAKKAKIGGIVGSVHADSSKLTKCTNYGSVTNNATTSTAKTDGNRSNIGGIAGGCEDRTCIEISECKNYGTVTSNNPEIEYVGGIIAVTNGGVAASVAGTPGNTIAITNCTNYGAVVLGAGAKPSVGGVVGCLCAATLDGCVNEGVLTANVASELKIGGIAGKFIADKACTIKDCTNGNSSDHTKGCITTSTGTAAGFVGGILGNIPAATTASLGVSGCKNYADITTSNPYVGNIGGFGGLWNATGCIVTMSGCDNYGIISNTSSSADAGDNKIAGLVANFQNATGTRSTVSECANHSAISTSKARTTSAQIGGLFGTVSYADITSCSNEGAISFSNAQDASESYSNAMNVGGIVGYGSAGVNFTNCTNSGNVEIGTCNSTGAGLVGGIAGYNIGGIFDNCDNSGSIYALNGYKASVYVGGIAGKLNGTTVKNGSDNTGKVYSTAENTSTVGGIVGIFQTAKIVIDGSTNKGTVYAEKKSGQFLVGGIMGDGASLAAEIKNCVNEGAVYAKQTAYKKQYFTVGGIVGRSRGKSGALHEIKSCTNKGTVTVTANTDNQLCNAGGIVGETNTYSKVTGCTNEKSGIIGCTNIVAASCTTRTAFAGGISGGDNESTAGNAGNDTVTGNTNYANVSAKVTNEATAIGAGGVFGISWRTGTFTGNKVYGTAEISASGTKTVGGAGAILGYYAHTNVVNLTGQEVQKTVTVNGTAWSKDASWLCPTSGHPVTATYKD